MSEQSENDPLEEILIALRDEDVAVREGAIQRLQGRSWSIGYDAKNGIPSLAEFTTSLEVLGKRQTHWLQQSRIVETLLLSIDDSSVRVRSTTALLLGDVADFRAQEALIRHLRDDPSAHARRMCAAALDWTPASSQKVEAFIAALKDPDWGVALCACGSLGRSEDMRVVEPLRTAMSSPAWKVQFSACEALLKLGVVDQKVVNLLEQLDQSPEAKEHNDMTARANEIDALSEPENRDRDSQVHTTARVLELARRMLP